MIRKVFAPPCEPPNACDGALGQQLSMLRMARQRGAMCLPGRPHPWIEMPASADRFQRVGTLALPADDGTDNQVLRFRVPFGWDGILLTVTNLYTGAVPVFGEGSGDLTWRIQRNFQWFRDLGAITITLGDLQSPYPLEGGGYRIYSNQVITYFVNVAVGAAARLDPNGRIVCALSGWFYPISQYSMRAA